MSTDRLQIPLGAAGGITFTLTNSLDNNAVLDMSAAIGIVITLYDVNGKKFAKFSKIRTGSLETYSPIDTTGTATGLLTISYTEEQTRKAAAGKCYADIKVTFTDVNGTNNDVNYITPKNDIGDLLDNRVKNVETH